MYPGTHTVFERISVPGAYFEFRVQEGRLIEEGRLFEKRQLLTKLQGLRVCFYDVAFIKKRKMTLKVVHSTSTSSSPSSSLSITVTSSLASF